MYPPVNLKIRCRSRGIWMEADKLFDSDSNPVNLGNSDNGGLNVNNWNDRNPNIGLAVARQSSLSLLGESDPTAEHRAALIGGLRNGFIQFIATDHAPHTKDEKHAAFAKFSADYPGKSNTEIARAAAYYPGSFVNPHLKKQLPGKKFGKGFGQIKEGFIGSLTVLNMKKKTLVRRKDLKTKCGWSPLEGRTMPGSVEAVFVKGVRV